MTQPIRISDDLYFLAQNVSLAMDRPIAKQVEYWARLGAALDEAGISDGWAYKLLRDGASADDIAEAIFGDAIYRDVGLPMLKEQQRKDAEDVAAGRRTARSLWAFPEGTFKNARITPNPDSEFSKPGEGW